MSTSTHTDWMLWLARKHIAMTWLITRLPQGCHKVLVTMSIQFQLHSCFKATTWLSHGCADQVVTTLWHGGNNLVISIWVYMSYTTVRINKFKEIFRSCRNTLLGGIWNRQITVNQVDETPETFYFVTRSSFTDLKSVLLKIKSSKPTLNKWDDRFKWTASFNDQSDSAASRIALIELCDFNLVLISAELFCCVVETHGGQGSVWTSVFHRDSASCC